MADLRAQPEVLELLQDRLLNGEPPLVGTVMIVRTPVPTCLPCRVVDERAPRRRESWSDSAVVPRRLRMSWKLEGSYFETCSCDVVCPCLASFALSATHDRCRVVLVFNVKNGEVEGTDVRGLTAAAWVDSPKVLSEGN